MIPEAIPVRDLVFAAIAGTAIAAACGLRAFLPLLALGAGVRLGFLHVVPAGAWIASTPALIALAWATVLELAADKVPALDHALDVVATVLRPLAAAVAGWCTFVGVHPALAVAASVILGAGAMSVHVTKAKVRLGSSVLTLGAANPVISFVEDALALGIAAVSVLAPLAALAAVVLLVWALLRVFRRPRALAAPPAGK